MPTLPDWMITVYLVVMLAGALTTGVILGLKIRRDGRWDRLRRRSERETEAGTHSLPVAEHEQELVEEIHAIAVEWRAEDAKAKKRRMPSTVARHRHKPKHARRRLAGQQPPARRADPLAAPIRTVAASSPLYDRTVLDCLVALPNGDGPTGQFPRGWIDSVLERAR
jgi:hypothetical protein